MLPASVIFFNENENCQKRKIIKFVNDNLNLNETKTKIKNDRKTKINNAKRNYKISTS